MKKDLKKKLKQFAQSKRSIVSLTLACLLLLVVMMIYFVMQHGTAENHALLLKDAYGVLLLGSDEGATQTNGGNHTDSITYVAINKKTKKAYALPIYRDSLILNECTQTQININHIYRENGAACLTKSVSALLELPVDYYIYITAKGFVTLFNTIGPIELTPEASYCSHFGNDQKEYCFREGQTETFDGNALLAYARYRGTHSGEQRANRHVQILNKGYEHCLADTIICGRAVLEGIKEKDIATDLPYEELLETGAYIRLEVLGTLAGVNFEDHTGWHHKIDPKDKQNKTERIRQEIFSS